MNRATNKALALLVFPALALSGCGETGSARQLLGMERKPPDAFSVSSHAPLEVPANLDAPLPKPQPGAARPQEASPASRARSVVLGQPLDSASSSSLPASATPASAAEAALLSRTGADRADSSIRATVNEEAAEDADTQGGPLDFLIFWRDKAQPGVAVDAKAEAERLRQNREAGKPATEGGTPVVEESGRLNAPEEIQ
jgi:hypothetical protein